MTCLIEELHHQITIANCLHFWTYPLGEENCARQQPGKPQALFSCHFSCFSLCPSRAIHFTPGW